MTAAISKDAKAQEDGIRFSLMLLMLVTFAFSCWLAILKHYPHVAIFGMSLFLAVYSVLVVNYYVRKKRHWTVILASLTTSLLLWACFYVLSIGPATRIHDQAGRATQEILQTVYAPVISMAEANTTLRDYLNLYAELWRNGRLYRSPEAPRN